MATGTIPNNKIDVFSPSTLSNVSLNDVTTAGVYYFSSTSGVTDIPEGGNGYIIVITQSSILTKQIFFRLGTIGTNDGNMWHRNKGPDGWGDWWKLTGTKS